MYHVECAARRTLTACLRRRDRGLPGVPGGMVEGMNLIGRLDNIPVDAPDLVWEVPGMPPLLT
jgi:hypothetical protein